MNHLIKKLVDAESFCKKTEYYNIAIKVVKQRQNEYLRLKTDAQRQAWLKQIVFDVCHCGLTPKEEPNQLKQSKLLLKQIMKGLNKWQ